MDRTLDLETERLRIRPFTMADLEELHAIIGDPVVMRFIPAGPSPSIDVTTEVMENVIRHQEAHGYSIWAVTDKFTGKMLGDCGLFLLDGIGPEIEINYHLAVDHWGRGFATEAAAECIRYGFDVLELERIIGLTDPQHVASQRVLEKNGLRFEAIKKSYNKQLAVYSISRSHFEELKGPGQDVIRELSDIDSFTG